MKKILTILTLLSCITAYSMEPYLLSEQEQIKRVKAMHSVRQLTTDIQAHEKLLAEEHAKLSQQNIKPDERTKTINNIKQLMKLIKEMRDKQAQLYEEAGI